MASNAQRASWAEEAALAYVKETRCNEYYMSNKDEVIEVLGDLIGDLGHFAETAKLSREDYIEIVAHGLGMWSAERRAPNYEGDNEPGTNDSVEINITEEPLETA